MVHKTIAIFLVVLVHSIGALENEVDISEAQIPDQIMIASTDEKTVLPAGIQPEPSEGPTKQSAIVDPPTSQNSPGIINSATVGLLGSVLGGVVGGLNGYPGGYQYRPPGAYPPYQAGYPGGYPGSYPAGYPGGYPSAGGYPAGGYYPSSGYQSGGYPSGGYPSAGYPGAHPAGYPGNYPPSGGYQAPYQYGGHYTPGSGVTTYPAGYGGSGVSTGRPFRYQPYPSPYHSPYHLPYYSPYHSPYHVPYRMPYRTPFRSPYHSPYHYGVAQNQIQRKKVGGWDEIVLQTEQGNIVLKNPVASYPEENVPFANDHNYY